MGIRITTLCSCGKQKSIAKKAQETTEQQKTQSCQATVTSVANQATFSQSPKVFLLNWLSSGNLKLYMFPLEICQCAILQLQRPKLVIITSVSFRPCVNHCCPSLQLKKEEKRDKGSMAGRALGSFISHLLPDSKSSLSLQRTLTSTAFTYTLTGLKMIQSCKKIKNK